MRIFHFYYFDSNICLGSRPLQPIILTRDSAQKHVFGLGYPSLPVMSIEEFYDDRARKGWYDQPKSDAQSLMDRATKDGQELVSQEEQEAGQKVSLIKIPH